jgi:DNA-binding PadR family transcriptional regulator
MEATIGAQARQPGPAIDIHPLVAKMLRKMARRMFRHMLSQMFMQRGGGRHGRHGWARPGDWSRFGGSPRGFPGPRFGRGPRVGRGDVRAAILSLLAEKPYNGYQLMQEIAERSGGVWQPSAGSIYPALQLLEDEGLVTVEEAEGKRTFRLTDAGRAHVEARREELNAVWDSVADTVDDSLLELRDLFFQLGGAALQVAHAGTKAQIEEARTVLINTRRQLYRILASDEPTDTEMV